MLTLIGIGLAALPFLIACVRNVGFIASVLVLLLTVVIFLAAFSAGYALAAVPWLLALVFACCATGQRARDDKKRHAELMQALAAKQEKQ